MIKEGTSDERVFELLVLVSLIGMGCHHMYNPVAQFPIKTLFPEAAYSYRDNDCRCHEIKSPLKNFESKQKWR
jgi:hypothetical protein